MVLQGTPAKLKRDDEYLPYLSEDTRYHTRLTRFSIQGKTNKERGERVK